MEGCRSNAGPQVRRDGHGATMGADEEGRTETETETETGIGTGHRALLAHGMLEEVDE